MLWSIGLNIGEAFTEIVAHSSEQEHFQRWNLLSKPLLTGIHEFLKKHGCLEIESFRISTSLGLHFKEKNLGTPAAFLVTRGFEEWLTIEALRTADWSSDTFLPYIDQDLVFPIQERIAASGEIILPLNLKEIGPVVDRLKLLGVQRVVVGLLHSPANFEHEKILSDFLKQEGFEVFAGSNSKTSDLHPRSEDDEKARWVSLLEEAYLKPAFIEYFESFFQDPLFQRLASEDKVFFIDENGFSQKWPEIKFGQSVWTEPRLLQQLAGDNGACYFGLERWYGYFPVMGESWSECRRLQHTPASILLPIQPSQVLKENVWGLPMSSTQASGYLPGPICLGRGNQLMPVDLMYLRGYLDNVSGFEIKNHKKVMSKVVEALQLLMPGKSQQRHDSQTASEEVLLSLLQNLTPMWKLNRPIHFLGPLAPAMYQVLKNTSISTHLQLDTDSSFWLGKSLIPEYLGDLK